LHAFDPQDDIWAAINFKPTIDWGWLEYVGRAPIKKADDLGMVYDIG
jgi:hypothetical protein